jgi:hypothetical protein
MESIIDVDKFGPFANTMAVATFLVATFAGLLFKAMGRISRWTWFVPTTSTFMILLPARVISWALIAVTYVLINPDNYIIFFGLAIVLAIVAFWQFFVFNRLRIIHVMEIPEVGNDGQPLVINGKEIKRSIVIGTEKDMMPRIKKIFREACEQHRDLTIRKFLSGFGNAIYDPFNVWPAEVLARISNGLTAALVYTMFGAVMTLYLASLSLSIWMKAMGD